MNLSKQSKIKKKGIAIIRKPFNNLYSKGIRGLIGPVGPTGPRGPIGPQGPNGENGTQIKSILISQHGRTQDIIDDHNINDKYLDLSTSILYKWNGTRWIDEEQEMPYYFYDIDKYNIWHIKLKNKYATELICKIDDIILDIKTSTIYIQTHNGFISYSINNYLNESQTNICLYSSFNKTTSSSSLTTYTEFYNMIGCGTSTRKLINVQVNIIGLGIKDITEGIVSIRLYDIKNSNVLAENTNISVSLQENSLVDLGIISNQSINPSIWSIQGKIVNSMSTLEILNFMLTYLNS